MSAPAVTTDKAAEICHAFLSHYFSGPDASVSVYGYDSTLSVKYNDGKTEVYTTTETIKQKIISDVSLFTINDFCSQSIDEQILICLSGKQVIVDKSYDFSRTMYLASANGSYYLKADIIVYSAPVDSDVIVDVKLSEKAEEKTKPKTEGKKDNKSGDRRNNKRVKANIVVDSKSADKSEIKKETVEPTTNVKVEEKAKTETKPVRTRVIRDTKPNDNSVKTEEVKVAKPTWATRVKDGSAAVAVPTPVETVETPAPVVTKAAVKKDSKTDVNVEKRNNNKSNNNAKKPTVAAGSIVITQLPTTVTSAEIFTAISVFGEGQLSYTAGRNLAFYDFKDHSNVQKAIDAGSIFGENGLISVKYLKANRNKPKQQEQQ